MNRTVGTNYKSHEKRSFPLFVILALVALLAGVGAGYLIKQKNVKQKNASPDLSMNTPRSLELVLRKLWADHALWNWNFVVAATNKSPDLDATRTRVMKNQEDIGNAMAIFYGKDNGLQLTQLLKKHEEIAGRVVKAAMANDTKTFNEENSLWKKNAEDIAIFLSQLNSNWSKNDLNSMFNEHLKALSHVLNARLEKKWQDQVDAVDHVFDQAQQMAEEFVRGIMQQFPNKFGANMLEK